MVFLGAGSWPSSAAVLRSDRMSTPSTIELGLPGLDHSGGYLNEEWHLKLSGRNGAYIYREMSENDATIGSALYSIEAFLRRVEWEVESADDADEESNFWAEFVEDCMDDMDLSFDAVVSDALTMIKYGYALHEVVYKIRKGDSKNKRFRSKYNDGLVGWRNMSLRSQTTICRWDIDDATGEIRGAYQQAPPFYNDTYLPLDRCLLFRTKTERNNPEGISVLRRAYRSWSFKKRIEEIEAVGISRDLNGLPVFHIPAKFMAPNATPAEQAVRAEFKKMAALIARDQLSSLVLPAEYDGEGKQTGYSFKLVSSGGAKQIPADPVIRRYDARILMTLAAEFLLLGTEKQGSFALGSEKNANFIRSLEWYVQVMADQFNIAVQRLMEVNGVPLEKRPEICFKPMNQPGLQELGMFLQACTSGGLITPTAELEEHLREAANLPEPSDAEMALIEQRITNANTQSEPATLVDNAQAPTTPEPPPSDAVDSTEAD